VLELQTYATMHIKIHVLYAGEIHAFRPRIPHYRSRSRRPWSGIIRGIEWQLDLAVDIGLTVGVVILSHPRLRDSSAGSLRRVGKGAGCPEKQNQ
jgi:hypothetical protein